MDKRAKIMIVDDENDLRENLKYVFRTKDYEVELAADGVAALKKLETYTPDLIVLDLNMPNMGGIEFYQKICEGQVPKYPVFVLTARANMEQFFRDFNVDGFMSKPFEIPDLIREVGHILDHNAGIAPGAVLQDGGDKKVFLVESDSDIAGKVGAAFLNRGFTVNLARTGTEAIERISRNVPDIACVRMTLPDISGDLVISKLKRMAKTSRVRYILFVSSMGEREIVTDTIQHKCGVDQFVIVSSEDDLVDAVEVRR
ncbi:MAG: response regulator [Candidatus Omnitrophica bacterium]|nr:response regulator [Candidatus Omnitrophota bacterium]